MAPGGLFSINMQNPYDRNHLMRLSGTLTAFFLAVISSFLSVYYFSSDTTVAVGSTFGLLMVVMVEGWIATWFQVKTKLCEYAGSSAGFSQYEWRDLFESAYGTVDKNFICAQTRRMMIIATACWVISMVAALVAVGLMVRTRMKGSPEIRAQQHYDHCHQAMLVMGGCIFGIAVPPVVFTVLLPSYIMVGNTPLTIREGVFVGVLAGLSLIPAIIGYQVDKTVLKSKIEFDSLIWATAVDTGAVKRAEMLQDIEALEAAKFGGLIAPSDLARQAASDGQSGVSKFLLQRAGPWK